jgi:cyclopropane fatty-acyl-phospholipid synthase-like methyltransferase
VTHIDLLRALPKTKRNIQKRAEGKADPSIVRISKQFGQMYFDGPREYGYGGYRYDGRWRPVARDIVAHFGLKPGMRVLDIGCAKGFLIKDLMLECSGLEAFGIDVSSYALSHCEPEVVGRLHLGSAESLPFPDLSFDAVLSINTIHNLNRNGCMRAFNEINRVCKVPANCFVQVDAYRNDQEKELFESWCLTAITYLTPSEWIALFEQAGYRGDYAWTILQADE